MPCVPGYKNHTWFIRASVVCSWWHYCAFLCMYFITDKHTNCMLQDVDNAVCWLNADWLTSGPKWGRERPQSSPRIGEVWKKPLKMSKIKKYSIKSTDCSCSGHFFIVSRTLFHFLSYVNLVQLADQHRRQELPIDGLHHPLCTLSPSTADILCQSMCCLQTASALQLSLFRAYLLKCMVQQSDHLSHPVYRRQDGNSEKSQLNKSMWDAIVPSSIFYT